MTKSSNESFVPRKSPRHLFYFPLENGQMITAKAKVRNAKKPVSITLIEQHIREALAAGGQGNGHKCAGAVCSRSHAKAFPHAFHMVDWVTSRVYVVTKLDKNGLPAECVVYSHQDSVAKWFDNSVGLKKLLALIEKHGPRTINLYPPVVRSRETGRRRGKNTGERTKVQQKGNALRLFRVKMGRDA